MKKEKIGILGGGFTGLSAAYYLSKKGFDVVVIESQDKLGGLAAGYKENNWSWSLEEHYHHWFTNDKSVLELAKEIGHKVITRRPKTSILSKDKMYQFDSPLSLLRYPNLGVIDKFRTALLMTYFKILPFYKHLERITAKGFLIKYGGINAWNELWGPLFEGKFGEYESEIPAVWFWARIKKRTPSLSYPEGGYAEFIRSLEEKIASQGVQVKLNEKVSSVKKTLNAFEVVTDRSSYVFNRVICTFPTDLFLKIALDLPRDYVEKTKSLLGLGAVTLILRLQKSLLNDETYWLNVNEKEYPFLAVVEHTNFISETHYANEKVVYVGNYLKTNHRYFGMSTDELYNEFEPYLRKINKNLSKSWVFGMRIFKAAYAQPVVPLNYSRSVPSIETPVKNLYLGNMQQVYPWDRGTNYAVELGKKISDKISE